MSGRDHVPASVANGQAPVNLAPRAALASYVDLGAEHIAGSNHIFQLAPVVHGAATGLAYLTIEPAEDHMSRPEGADVLGPAAARARKAEGFAVVAGPTLVASGLEIPIRFAPKFKGDHEADVSVTILWGDGVSEIHRVRLRATARDLEDAPEHQIGGSTGHGAAQARPPTADLSSVSELHKTAFTNETEFTRPAVRGLGDEQWRAVDTVRAEALAYDRAPAEQAWWGPLAELAVTMAVGGIAAVIGRAIGSQLSNYVSRASRTLGDRAHNELVEYSKAAFADSVKDGLKNAPRTKLIAVATAPAKPGAPERSKLPQEVNQQNAFFSAQLAGVNAVRLGNEELLEVQKERLQHVLVRDPEAAITMMSALRHAAIGAPAYEEQRVQTQASWLSLLGRSHHGAEIVETHDEKRSVSALGQGTANMRGVLRIHVALPSGVHDVGSLEPKVTGATFDDVSQELADKLLQEDLRDQAIPLVIVLSNGGTITRDEVGRVRVSYAVPVADDRGVIDDHTDEPNRHRSGSTLLERVLGRSLAAWGVAEIKTNDATGRRGSAL